MEVFQLTTVPLWTILTAAASVLLYWYSTWTHDFFKKQGIKGPKPWPLVGNIPDLFRKSEADTDIENAKSYGKLYGMFFGRRPSLVVADPELIKEITMKEFSSFVNRTPFRAIQEKPLDRLLSALMDDHWRHVRASLSPTFTSGKLKEMFATISDCATAIVGYLDKQDGKPVNSKDVLSGFTMDVIAGTAFGLDVRSLENQDSPFLLHANNFFSKSPKKVLAAIVAITSQRLAKLCRKLGLSIFDQRSVEYLENVVKSAVEGRDRAEGRKDFVQLCLSQLVDLATVDKESLRETDGHVWTSKGLISDEIFSNALIFLLAGYDTTSTFLNMFCYAMAVYPKAQERLHKEIIQHAPDGEISYEKLKDFCYLDWSIDEAFRMFPPSLRLDRQCNQTTTIGGVCIEAGTTVNIPVYAVHHDSDYWPEPEVFRPERFSPEEKSKQHPCAYMPFGLGPRICIGMRLAHLEVKTVIVKLIHKFEIVPTESTQKPPLKLGVGLGFLVPEKPVMLLFKRRQV